MTLHQYSLDKPGQISQLQFLPNHRARVSPKSEIQFLQNRILTFLLNQRSSFFYLNQVTPWLHKLSFTNTSQLKSKRPNPGLDQSEAQVPQVIQAYHPPGTPPPLGLRELLSNITIITRARQKAKYISPTILPQQTWVPSQSSAWVSSLTRFRKVPLQGQ